MTPSELWRHLREDWEAHGRPLVLANPGYQSVALYRFGKWARQQPQPLRAALLLAYWVGFFVCRNLYGIEIPLDAHIGHRLWVAHQSGIVVNHGVVIGDDCMIRHNVTIGSDRRGSRRQPPRLGNRVEVGAGAVILAGVEIADDARIGPNAVVMKDVPAGGSAFAAPARVLPPLARATDSEEAS